MEYEDPEVKTNEQNRGTEEQSQCWAKKKIQSLAILRIQQPNQGVKMYCHELWRCAKIQRKYLIDAGSFHKDMYAVLAQNEGVQTSLTSEEYKVVALPKKRADEITVALTKFIAMNLRPLSMLSSELFQNSFIFGTSIYHISTLCLLQAKLI
eukprot:TRINITY_DN35965_c0_g1_i1.p2 TRINITY_DN35965_c0_g1~~TRINITY_DN35965_c0_g1_i1.p2  ORF type:complete len:152 (+),score=5.76 TRINITY_DN35965_c0_g1_i1:3-458(+)